jgi:hypothetical protein
MSEIERVRDTQRRVGQTEVAERAMTALPFVPHEGVVSPYVAGANSYITPVWRDCTPARSGTDEGSITIAGSQVQSVSWTAKFTGSPIIAEAKAEVTCPR